MNNEIKPLTVGVILIVFSALLVGKFWARGEALAVPAFSHIHAHPNGNLYIKLGNQLFGFDDNGTFSEKIDLAKFGVDERGLTDFAFFGNGDLLLRRRVSQHDFIYSLQRYFRFRNPRDTSSKNPEDGLFRCGGETCHPFTTPALNLNDAFSLAIDWTTDRVFISDTSRHTVSLFSSAGERLDSASDFRFPNQIEYRDGRLYIADTNHHRLLTLGVDGDRFGGILESMDTRAGPAVQYGEVWPSGFLLTGSQRWIRNAQGTMAKGGIYLFGKDGAFLKRVKLPGGADPFGLSAMGETILVSDYSQGRLYRLDKAGEILPDFLPDVLRAPLAKIEGQKNRFHKLEILFTGLFAAGLAGGVGFAVIQQRRNPSPTFPARMPASYGTTGNEADLYWIKPRARFRLIAISLALFNLLLVVVLGLAYVMAGSGFAVFLSNDYGIVALALGMAVVMLMQLRRKIGVSETHILIVPAWGKATPCFKADILYSDNLILFGTAVADSADLIRTFPPKDVENLLYPLIKQGRPVERAEIQAMLWRRKSLLAAGFLVFAALIAAFLYLGFRQA